MDTTGSFRLTSAVLTAKALAKTSTTVFSADRIQDNAPPTIRPMVKTQFSFFVYEEDPSDDLYFIKRLLMLTASNNDVSNFNAAQLFINIHNYIFPQCARKLRAVLESFQFTIDEDVDMTTWAKDSGQFEDVNLNDGIPFAGLTMAHVYALVGLHACFLGRSLTSMSYPNWMARRMQAFSSALGVESEEGGYDMLQPGFSYCASSYAWLSSKREVRRVLFKDIENTAGSSTNRLLAAAYKTSLVYLAGTEMSMFMLIFRYILCENPILLAWNEVAKHADKLIAAFDKWVKLGRSAPYCKLLYTEEECTEFNRRHLSIFSDIAIAIARQEGMKSLQNYKGVEDTDTTSPIVRTALMISKMYGGAQTHITNDMLGTILVPNGNNELKQALIKGADIQALKATQIDNTQEGGGAPHIHTVMN